MGKRIRVRFRGIVLTAVLFVLAVIILVCSGAAAEGVRRGLEYTARLLIPSLFPFMVLSSFMMRTGASEVFGRLLSPVTRHLFHLPEEASAAIVLSFIGGFPVGAKCVRLLADEKLLSDRQAEQMMLFCICSGPAFLITGIGTLLLGNPEAGVILYVSQLLSGLVLGIIAGRLSPQPSYTHSRPHALKKASCRVGDAFLLACTDGASSILQLTALVLCFSVWLSVADQLGLPSLTAQFLQFLGVEAPTAKAAFSILFEVTTACRRICDSGCPLWVLSFAVGLGGLCVHFQIFSMLGNIRLSRPKVLAFRLINACFSAFLVYVFCLFHHPAAPVFALWDGTQAEWSSTTLIGAAALVLMSGVFVLSLQKPRFPVLRTFLKR